MAQANVISGGSKKLGLVIMDYMLDAYVGYDIGSTEPDDIPRTDDAVWVLAKQYNATSGEERNAQLVMTLVIFLCVILLDFQIAFFTFVSSLRCYYRNSPNSVAGGFTHPLQFLSCFSMRSLSVGGNFLMDLIL